MQTLVDMTSRPVKGARLYFSLALRIVGVDCPQCERNTSQVFLNLEVRSRAITQHNPTVPSAIMPYRVPETDRSFPSSKSFH